MLRYGLLFPAPMNFQNSGGTPSPTPGQGRISFDPGSTGNIPDNFGFSTVTVTGGTSIDSVGAPASLGTATVNLDGIELVAKTSTLRPYRFNLYFNGEPTAACENIPVQGSAGNLGKVTLPIRIPLGTAVTMDLAVPAANASITVIPKAFQSSVESTIVRIAGLGSGAVVSSQGIEISAADTWFEIGTLAADAKGFGVVHFGPASDFGRTPSTLSGAVLEIGIGAAGSEQLLIPNIAAIDTVNNVVANDAGPYFIDLPAGTRIAARARRADGAFPDHYCAQVAVMY